MVSVAVGGTSSDAVASSGADCLVASVVENALRGVGDVEIAGRTCGAVSRWRGSRALRAREMARLSRHDAHID